MTSGLREPPGSGRGGRRELAARSTHGVAMPHWPEVAEVRAGVFLAERRWSRELAMDAELISFGLIEIGGRRCEHDVVLEGGVVRRGKKGASKAYRDPYGPTPLSPDEAIPWSARLLIIGTGVSGRLPIMPELYEEAHPARGGGRRRADGAGLPAAERPIRGTWRPSFTSPVERTQSRSASGHWARVRQRHPASSPCRPMSPEPTQPICSTQGARHAGGSNGAAK